jgi:hypothetical protein
MTEDSESSSFLSRTYKLAKLIAVGTASVVGFIISLIALDVSKGHWWVDVKFPLYGVVLIVTAVFVVCAGVSIWLVVVVRTALDSRSFYRNEAKSLKAKVSTLRDMAYTDSITGIPNSNKLKEDVEKLHDTGRCLVLLDLKNFGEINKKYNHWVGDEYLRRFSQMVTDSGRRNEFLFKSRPMKDLQKTPGEERIGDEVKAFRKNSGGDEFFILLDGSIVDGLGYLNRLIKRAGAFEQMAFDIMGERRAFGFSAGVVSIAYGESFESVSKRVSECLGLALEKDSRRGVYWIKSELPTDLTAVQKKLLEETDLLFGKGLEQREAGVEIYPKR